MPFNSIWGDLNIPEDKITKEAAKSEEKVVPPVEKPAETTAVEKPEVDAEGKPIEKEKPAVEKPAEKKEEEDQYEFTDDDVSKAYTMLDEEGVLDLTDEDEFESTPKGLADVIATTVRNKLAKEIAAIPPVVQDFYQHINAGKNPKEFVAEAKVAWSEQEIDTVEKQKVALRQFYTDQGMSKEDVESEIDDAEAGDKLEKKADIALKTLVKKEEESNVAKDAAVKQAKIDAAKARDEEIEELSTFIDTTKEIAGWELDDVKRKNFKDYLFKVNPRTGKSVMQENMADSDRRMTIAFLDFANYTKADLTKEVANELTKNRKKKLTKYSDKNVANTNSSAVVKTKTTRDSGKKIKFPSIFGSDTIEIED